MYIYVFTVINLSSSYFNFAS